MDHPFYCETEGCPVVTGHCNEEGCQPHHTAYHCETHRTPEEKELERRVHEVSEAAIAWREAPDRSPLKKELGAKYHAIEEAFTRDFPG